MVPDRNPWKEIYMEIYHKNKDQHDKGLSDEVLKDLLELQRINKIEPPKMDQITDVSSLFKYDMEMRIGDKIRRFKLWINILMSVRRCF